MFENIVFGDVRKTEFKFEAQGTTTGAQGEAGNIRWDEYVHVVPIYTEDQDFGGKAMEDVLGSPYKNPNASLGNYKSGADINRYLGWVYDSMIKDNHPQSEKYKNLFEKNKYTGAEIYKMFLNPRICNDEQVKQQLVFKNPNAQKTIRKKGPGVQEGTAQKRKLLYGYGSTGRKNSIYVICTKMMYILYYGKKAIQQYNKDKQTNPDRYRELMGKATRLLWTEFEHTGKPGDSTGQWHRGVDFYFKSGKPVYSPWPGQVISPIDKEYRTSIYHQELGVTITYCHMEKGDNVKGLHNKILAGDAIGKESGHNPSEDEYWKNPKNYPNHTHVEINPGKYTGTINIPWSTGVGAPTLKSFAMGANMSLNPYPYFLERIQYWEQQFGEGEGWK